jgi:tetratricopeptide (TPR) repeat protein
MEATTGYARLSALYGSSSDPDADRAVLRGLELANELGDRTAVGTLLTMQGMLLAADPERFADSITVSEKAVEAARATGDPVQVLSSSRGLVWNYMLDGRFADAQTKLDSLLGELERLGKVSSPTDLYLATRWMHDGVLFYCDQLDAAHASATVTHKLALEIPNRTVESGTATTLAQIHFVRAEYEEAREWAERALRTSEEIGSVSGIYRGLTLMLAARGALGESVNYARHRDMIESGIAQGGNFLTAVHILVETLVSLDDAAWAEKLARTASERAAGRLRKLFSSLALGAATTQRGPAQWGDAERSLTGAMLIADAIGMRSCRAMALIDVGRLAMNRHQPDAALNAWRSAREVFADIGMRRYERICTELLTEGEGQESSIARPRPEAGASAA